MGAAAQVGVGAEAVGVEGGGDEGVGGEVDVGFNLGLGEEQGVVGRVGGGEVGAVEGPEEHHGRVGVGLHQGIGRAQLRPRRPAAGGEQEQQKKEEEKPRPGPPLKGWSSVLVGLVD